MGGWNMPEGNYCLPEETPEYQRKLAILANYEKASDDLKMFFWEGVELGYFDDVDDYIIDNWIIN